MIRNQSGCTGVKESDDMKGIGIFKRYFGAVTNQRFLSRKWIIMGNR